MKKHLNRILAGTLAVILLCLCACGLPAGVSSLRIGTGSSGPAAVPAYHASLPAAQKIVLSSGGLHLLFDETTGAVSVYDTVAAQRWNALPEAENTAAAVLVASLVSSAGRVTVNSQDNCAAFGTLTYTTENGSLLVTYTMAENAGTAGKAFASVPEDELYLSVPVRYALEDDALNVSVDCSQINVSAGYVLEKLSLLPTFGALKTTSAAAQTTAPAAQTEPEVRPDETAEEQTEEPTDETAQKTQDAEKPLSGADLPAWSEHAASFYRDFLLVPDGCGAVMYTDTDSFATSDLAFPLYSTGESASRACVGCFGVNRDRNGFVGVITEGDALASVRAIRASAFPDDLNVVYPEFTLTAAVLSNGTYYYMARYTGKLNVIYKFLRETNGSAVMMASACREALIRSGMLPADDASRVGFPLNVSFVMSVDGGKKTVTTSIEQAEELAGLLKAKGVSEMNLVLNGLFQDGLYQTGNSALKIARGCGNKNALESLYGYAAGQGFKLYAGVNLLYSAYSIGAAKNIRGEKQTGFIKNPLAPYIYENGKSRYLSSVKYLERNTSNVINGAGKLPFFGYAVNDAGSVLYADASAGADAAEVAARIGENLSALTANRLLLVNGADFCMLKNASVVTGIPLRTSNAESEAYQATPLIPAILHGTVVYSGTPANAESLYLVQFLKSVEYGAALNVQWVYESGSHLFYEQTYAEVAEFYVRAAAALADLSGKRIIGHEKLSDGVYACEYDGGTVVFVNYNNYTVNVGNIYVPPYDFIRIN